MRSTIVILFVLSTCSLFQENVVYAHRLPIDIQFGYERNEFEFSSENGESSNDEDSDFNNRPIIKIISSTLLSCFSKIKGNGIYGDSCDGLGIRASASQRRLSGNWFELSNSNDPVTEFHYNSNQFAFELLGGRINEVGVFAALGLRAGLNSYDLLVANSSQLFTEHGKQALFVNGVFHLDIGYILTAPLGLGRDAWNDGLWGT